MRADREAIRASGEWWADPWWFADNWLQVVPCSHLEVVNAVEYLKQVFTAHWLRSYQSEPIENVFLRTVLYDRTAFGREYLLSLAERLRRLQGIRGSHVIIKGLRVGKEVLWTPALTEIIIY